MKNLQKEDFQKKPAYIMTLSLKVKGSKDQSPKSCLKFCKGGRSKIATKLS